LPGRVKHRLDQKIHVAVIDPGNGIAELDGYVAGEAGCEPEHAFLAVLTELTAGT
jgi:hypothetical protein